MRPIIGITCGSKVSASSSSSGRVYQENSVGFDYIRAIEQAGGTPLVLPIVENPDCISDFTRIIDGLLLSGGGDIDPFLFHEEPIPNLGNIDPSRDWVEIRMSTVSLEEDIPILAICRGIQVLNVAAGGTLYQDISQHPAEIIKHRQNAPGWYASHSIHIEPDSLLYEIFGSQMARVNSYHHQAVLSPADFHVSARSTDGIIEAIESSTHRFVVGVQFHPEMMWERHPEAANLFTARTASASPL